MQWIPWKKEIFTSQFVTQLYVPPVDFPQRSDVLYTRQLCKSTEHGYDQVYHKLLQLVSNWSKSNECPFSAWTQAEKPRFNNPIFLCLQKTPPVFILDRVTLGIIFTFLWLPLLLSIPCDLVFIRQHWRRTERTRLRNYVGIYPPSEGHLKSFKITWCKAI